MRTLFDAPRLSGLTLGAWAVLVLLWLLHVVGVPAPGWLAGSAAAAALLLTAWRVLGLRRFLSEGRRPLGLILAALLVVGLVVGFAGLSHEVGKGYYTDEGHYLRHARDVNAGKPLSPSFVYPHLTYYLDAFALWLAELFPAGVAFLARTVYGVDDAAAIPWLVLRLVTAGLGVATVVPVFFLAKRVAGSVAALLAGALVIFSVHYQLGFQVNISDVPSAFFATLTMMFVGRLLDAEKTRDYVLAGLASGLAAAAKYPAGIVAVAIVAIWLTHRVRQRRWGWGLAWAGLASLGTFLVLHPSLFVMTDAALNGPRGLLFGVRQYSGGGWVGVMPGSNTAYYLGKLAASFGWPALALAAVGLFTTRGAARRRLLLLAPFPATFLLLICSMNMVVLRNLFPVIPTLAVFVGVLAASVRNLAAFAAPAGRCRITALLAAAALGWPAAATLRQTAALTRASTRDVMGAWVRAHVPLSAGILKESYTPNFDPYEYLTLERRFAFRIRREHLDDPRFDYLLLAASAYRRWLRPEHAGRPQGSWYRRVFETHELVHRIEPRAWRRGPELRLYRLPRAPELVRDETFGPAAAFPTHPSMEGESEIRFTGQGRLTVFRGAFAAGGYEVRAQGRLEGAGELALRAADNELLTTVTVVDGRAVVVLPRPGAWFFFLSLPKGDRLTRLTVDGYTVDEPVVDAEDLRSR